MQKGYFRSETEKMNGIVEFRMFELQELVYNQWHNIFAIYSVSVQVSISASQKELDIKYNKLCILVTSPFTERLKN